MEELEIKTRGQSDSDPLPTLGLNQFGAVAIGASTGAPRVLETMVKKLPADLPLPIFIAQHMPPSFTESFARRLDLLSPLTVVHAEDGMPVYDGVVYIGVGHQHMRVCRQGGRHRIEINDQPAGLTFYPSADELLSSCAKVYHRPVLGIVLSGIGHDGTLGAGAIKAKQGVVLTQSQSTCAVYGMPRSCVEANVSDAALNPDELADAILQLSPQHRGRVMLR